MTLSDSLASRPTWYPIMTCLLDWPMPRERRCRCDGGTRPPPRFAPRSRRGGTRLYDRENLFAELALIRDRIDVVVACGREEFYDGAQAYDVACRSMDDGLFWLAITQRIPMILDRIKTDD